MDLNFDSQYFPQLIAAILEFTQQEVQKSNIEAIFEYAFDPTTRQLTVCIFPHHFC
jgi:hypothetical protein